MENTVVEVERKFLLKRLPETALMPGLTALRHIKYAYTPNGDRYQSIWYTSPDWDSHEMKFSIVRKQGEGLNRVETTIDITEEEFDDRFFKSNDVDLLEKQRYMIPFGDSFLEVDKYLELDLITMELEVNFSTDDPDLDEKIEEFKNREIDFPEDIKDVLLIEVTGIPEFANKNLAK